MTDSPQPPLAQPSVQRHRFTSYSMTQVGVLPIGEQDRFHNGLVKFCYHSYIPEFGCGMNHDGCYTPLDQWGLYDASKPRNSTGMHPFVDISALEHQDRLREHMVRIEWQEPSFIFSNKVMNMCHYVKSGSYASKTALLPQRFMETRWHLRFAHFENIGMRSWRNHLLEGR